MKTKKPLGYALLVCGLALPVITYVGGQVYNQNVASYGGPPNQGAMILAFVAFAISVAAGFCMAAVGLVVTLVSLRKSTPRHN
jgi:hypothetical protein